MSQIVTHLLNYYILSNPQFSKRVSCAQTDVESKSEGLCGAIS